MKKPYLFLFACVFALFGISQAANFTDEMQKAHRYALHYWITTIKNINDAKMYSDLNRIAMAKMISNFAIKVLWLKPDESLNCSFSDVSDSLDAQYDYWVTKACQLWLMWLGDDWKIADKFNPNVVVTRAQFATAFSRALNRVEWTTIENWNPYYATHISYLHSKWVINSVDAPNNTEKRWYVMLMMQRASNIVADNSQDKTEEVNDIKKEEEDNSAGEASVEEVNKDTSSNDNEVSLWDDNNDASNETSTDNTSEGTSTNASTDTSTGTSSGVPTDTTCNSEETCVEYLTKLWDEKHEVTCVNEDGLWWKYTEYIVDWNVASIGWAFNMIATNTWMYLRWWPYKEGKWVFQPHELEEDVWEHYIWSESKVMALWTPLKCSVWVADRSVFNLPSNVEFLSIEEYTKLLEAEESVEEGN